MNSQALESAEKLDAALKQCGTHVIFSSRGDLKKYECFVDTLKNSLHHERSRSAAVQLRVDELERILKDKSRMLQELKTFRATAVGMQGSNNESTELSAAECAAELFEKKYQTLSRDLRNSAHISSAVYSGM